MLLIHTVILFLAISPTFEGKKKHNHKVKDEHIDRPEGVGTDRTPAHCLRRGAKNGVKPDLNGNNSEWLAAVCPGIMGKDNGKGPMKSKESQWESCAWGMEHGAVCQRCHAGDSHLGKGKKKYPSNDINLNGCAVRYKYTIMRWPRDSGPQQKQFLRWVKSKDTSSLPDKGLLDSICPGVFDSSDSGDASGDSAYEACMWGWKHGSKCMGMEPLSEQMVESADRGCSLRYKRIVRRG